MEFWKNNAVSIQCFVVGILAIIPIFFDINLIFSVANGMSAIMYARRAEARGQVNIFQVVGMMLGFAALAFSVGIFAISVLSW